MVDDIEQRVIALVTPYSGVYMFRKKKYDTYTAESSVHFDVRLDVDEAEELMNAFFTEFNVDPGNFKLETYYPEVEFSLNPFKKNNRCAKFHHRHANRIRKSREMVI